MPCLDYDSQIFYTLNEDGYIVQILTADIADPVTVFINTSFTGKEV